MTDFNDATDDDSFDPSVPDPEAVARLYVRLRQRVAGGGPGFDELAAPERGLLIVVFGLLLERLRREGGV